MPVPSRASLQAPRYRVSAGCTARNTSVVTKPGQVYLVTQPHDGGVPTNREPDGRMQHSVQEYPVGQRPGARGFVEPGSQGKNTPAVPQLPGEIKQPRRRGDSRTRLR